MDKKSLRIQIGNVSLPISVEPDQEERLLNISAQLNQTITQLSQKYQIKDLSKILSMLCLQQAIKMDEMKQHGVEGTPGGINPAETQDLIKALQEIIDSIPE